jgi:ribosomal protein S17E
MLKIKQLQSYDCGGYYLVKPVEETTAEEYIQLYKKYFELNKRAERINFLIDVIGLPSVLRIESFAAILFEADENEIHHIELSVATNDSARPIIGEMVKVLATKFNVTINITFHQNMQAAQEFLEMQIPK